MRIQKHILMLAILMVFTNHVFAQFKATATATATIVRFIDITKTSDLNFGNIAVSESNAGTTIITPTGNRSASGVVTLPGTSGTTAAAIFTVTGEEGYTFAIILPTADVTLINGTNEMTINSFTSAPSDVGTLTGGTATIKVGATLHVQAGQQPGTYTSNAPFNITVNYN